MMNLWYSLVNIVLPFQWVEFTFMKNALLAILLITPLFGLLGTMIVNNKMAFFSDALGHGAFTGIAIGALIGLVKPVLAAIVFSVVFALIITVIKNKSRASTDTIIGVFSSIAIAFGLVLLSLGGSFNKYSSYLIGDLLSITPSEILLLLVVFIIIVILWVLIFNKLLLVSINQSLARSRGVKTLLVEMIFTSIVAVIVTISIQWVGLLIINSLLVLPAAGARNITTNVRQYTLVAIIIAVFSGICGLIASYYLNTATGATIVLVSGIVFFLTLAFKNKFA
ncbi:iron chelate uptake ABC transporter family permease subunit [Acetobacterium paludosum]|uniref:Iron chelate uptake ABC transporter family permease subunit n=1 Tax=Acetobacterium paludosum TaxID=52693 RepID=A0A923I349_9FIRM|nr:metal ABC transporter permease [Acetobacterium paludosum]MBC3888210.1 iron chelate uptake ABC transporter family permease subunit [Acetobacterium paludosum]